MDHEGDFIGSLVLDLPDTVHAVFVHSPHGHARINGIDKDKAKSMPGVLAVLSHEDWEAENLGMLPVVHPVDYYDGRPMNLAPRPVFARGKVSHVGDTVACVVAESRELAWNAAEAVAVDYEVSQTPRLEPAQIA